MLERQQARQGAGAFVAVRGAQRRHQDWWGRCHPERVGAGGGGAASEAAVAAEPGESAADEPHGLQQAEG